MIFFFFYLFSLLDPHPHSECGSRRKIIRGSGSKSRGSSYCSKAGPEQKIFNFVPYLPRLWCATEASVGLLEAVAVPIGLQLSGPAGDLVVGQVQVLDRHRVPEHRHKNSSTYLDP